MHGSKLIIFLLGAIFAGVYDY